MVYAITEEGKPVVSVCSPDHIKALVELGNRPMELWSFTTEFLGENNLQVRVAFCHGCKFVQEIGSFFYLSRAVVCEVLCGS